MNILATEYSAQTNSFDIFLAGCRAPHCSGCFNPETWDFRQGAPCDRRCTEKILNKIQEFDLLIDNVMVMGGEPLDQEQSDLLMFLHSLKTTDKAVWVFTKYDFEAVPKAVKQVCDYVKCGPYDPSQSAKNHAQYGVQLASANQQIYCNGKDYGNLSEIQ